MLVDILARLMGYKLVVFVTLFWMRLHCPPVPLLMALCPLGEDKSITTQAQAGNKDGYFKAK